MITLYSGTPGSGKSYHAAVRIDWYIHHGGSLICNFPVAVPDGVNPKKPLLVSYWDNSEITPSRLAEYARQHHTLGKEGQTLLIVDEAQVIWNCRDFAARNRMDWITFFSQHRKLGFDILLISQNDRMIDRQIRMLIEYEVKHRKVNNYGSGGKILSLLTGGSTWFIAMQYWYGGNKVMLNKEMIRFKKSISGLYDSYAIFNDEKQESGIKKDAKLELNVKSAVSVYPPRSGGLLVPFRGSSASKADKKENKSGSPSEQPPPAGVC